MTEHAAALAGDSVYDMRRTGRNVIAIYDAGVGGLLPGHLHSFRHLNTPH